MAQALSLCGAFSGRAALGAGRGLRILLRVTGLLVLRQLAKTKAVRDLLERGNLGLVVHAHATERQNLTRRERTAARVLIAQ